jgi:cysteinyl-tRNA synthetase
VRAAADRARATFDTALAAGDADVAGSAVLGLEQALHDWSADTLQSGDEDYARHTLRGMVLELARAAESGLADPRERLAPLVEVLLEWRDAARQHGDFALADALRGRLNAAGVMVQDTFRGSRWTV